MIYLMIVVGIFALDYSVKAYVDNNRLQGSNEEYFGGKLILKNYHNKVGALGLLKGKPKLLRMLQGVALVCVLWEFLKALFFKSSFLVKLAWGCIAGGGSNNFYDRVVKGYVTDYFSIGVGGKKFRNTVFNLSDMFVFLGAVLLAAAQILSGLKKGK